MHAICNHISESPVPLEFTPVLGILIGVVVTLLLVAFVIMLILRMKYKSSKMHQQPGPKRRESSTSNNGFCQSRNNDNLDPDAEEYFCLQPSSSGGNSNGCNSVSKPNVVATMSRNHKVNGGHHQSQRSLCPPDSLDQGQQHNPDVIPGALHHVSIHGPGMNLSANSCHFKLLSFCFLKWKLVD